MVVSYTNDDRATDGPIRRCPRLHPPTYCKRGHLLDGPNGHAVPNGKGRTCKLCLRKRQREYQEQNREKIHIKNKAYWEQNLELRKELWQRWYKKQIVEDVPEGFEGVRLAMLKIRAETTNVQLSAFGENHTLREWAELFGLGKNTLHHRIKYQNLSIEEALTKKLYTEKRRLHCSKGHALEGENLYITPNGQRRYCRKCKSGYMKVRHSLKTEMQK